MRGLVHTAIISSGRSANVPAMTDMLKDVYHTWYVGKGEGAAYSDAGAKRVIESGGLIESRNAALDDAFADGIYCVQLSDDVKRLEWNDYLDLYKPQGKITIAKAVWRLYESALRNKASLIGIPPTPNGFFAKTSAETYNGFAIGDAFLCKPTELRFDTNLRLKEDYDFSLQHIAHGDGITRVNTILWSFQHYSNKGGAVSYRTDSLEQETVMYLLRKWSGALRLNPRRANELLFDAKGVKSLWERNRSKVTA